MTQYRTDVPELGVAVADNLHGKGLGAAVVCALVGLAKALGKSGVELTTMQGNDAAFRCYQRCGFEEQVRGSFEGMSHQLRLSFPHSFSKMSRPEH
jgi:RimJ/RimL family protein N-acetyltransferase